MSDDFSEDKPKLPSHIAYIVEDGKDDRSHWHRAGAAWPTKDGGLSVKLSALPVSGRLNLRLRDEVERLRAERQTAVDDQRKVIDNIEPKP